MRNVCFCFPRPPILAANNHSKTMFCKTLFWSLFQYNFILMLSKTILIVGPLQNPVGVQMGPPIGQATPTTLFFGVMGGPFFGPDLLIHFAHPFAHRWYPCASKWLPRPSHLVSFSMFCMLPAPTSKPNAVPTSLW